jgi:hypothetical protein
MRASPARMAVTTAFDGMYEPRGACDERPYMPKLTRVLVFAASVITVGDFARRLIGV